MHSLFWSVPACLLGLGLIVPGAFADSLVVSPPLKPQALSSVPPVPPRSLSAWQLNQLATRIAGEVGQVGGGNELTTVLDLLDLPGLKEIIDDRGNLRLPLGLRVYTSLGDTSIGFGTDF